MFLVRSLCPVVNYLLVSHLGVLSSYHSVPVIGAPDFGLEHLYEEGFDHPMNYCLGIFLLAIPAFLGLASLLFLALGKCDMPPS